MTALLGSSALDLEAGAASSLAFLGGGSSTGSADVSKGGCEDIVMCVLAVGSAWKLSVKFCR